MQWNSTQSNGHCTRTIRCDGNQNNEHNVSDIVQQMEMEMVRWYENGDVVCSIYMVIFDG